MAKRHRWRDNWTSADVMGVRVQFNKVNGKVEVTRCSTPPSSTQKNAVTAWVIEQLQMNGWQVADELDEHERIWRD